MCSQVVFKRYRSRSVILGPPKPSYSMLEPEKTKQLRPIVPGGSRVTPAIIWGVLGHIWLYWETSRANSRELCGVRIWQRALSMQSIHHWPLRYLHKPFLFNESIYIMKFIVILVWISDSHKPLCFSKYKMMSLNCGI